MIPIADIDLIARCIGNRTQYPWRFSKLFVPQLRGERRGSELTIDTPNASKSLSFRNQSIEDSSNLPDPDIIALQLIRNLPSCSPSGLPVHVGRSRDLHCPLRRRRWRNGETRATQTSRRSHFATSADRHLDSFAPARSASRPSRLILCSQQIQVYAQGVKANVLFFDRKPAAEKPLTSKLWIYDLRTNKHFTLKENTLKRR
jgi:hypothetical protein